MAKIVLNKISKQYKNGQIQALRNISIQCEDGKFFCLLGPAGAGKTTTIKLIAGNETVDRGSIFLDDDEVTNLEPKDRDIAVAYETYALYPHLTVRENLRFPLDAPIRKNEYSPEAKNARVVEIANMLGIGELLQRLPRQLSGGQRQRVALGRALVRKPKAYLLDEPIAHLDAKLRHRMRGELKRIQMGLGITTLYTTPDQLEALSLADNLAVINNGAIEQVGTPDEVYNKPVNIFVARFVGDPPMNTLKAVFDGDQLVLAGLLKLKLPTRLKNLLTSCSNGKDIVVGIRPKDFKLMPESSLDPQFKAIVNQVQVLGETSVVTLSADSLELRAKLATQQAPKRGENVALAFDINH
ncbi:MAG: ABC transporter ATP-binding protein, partial [Anaerolineaceae bacterium]|nr:ABC transporter ATP-binding protein [Anaerolineaceae bacterium]